MVFNLRIPEDGSGELSVCSFDQVTLCSNTVMECYQYILVDVEGIGEGVLALTVMGRCIVPKLTAYPYILCYDECHPKEPYERKFLVVNNSHIPGCYGLIAQVWHHIRLLLAEEIISGEKRVWFAGFYSILKIC
ncbi:hydrocephalus-inducing protein-like [Corvus kubaryi]|uniref:hydrocephalus-inducing protein-like n=1 Tax=Corvus kubaryi TaxID=68294 RepID=UPI001C03AF8D|nr:hydrocephalus-inducing protein-like [Corvus kubaryi]